MFWGAGARALTLLFLTNILVSLCTEIWIEPNRIYSGTLGDQQTLAFAPADKYQTSLFTINFTATSKEGNNSPTTVQLSLYSLQSTDPTPTLFSTIEVPSRVNGTVVSASAEGFVCDLGNNQTFIMLPVGRQNVSWEFVLSDQDKQLHLDTVTSSTLPIQGEQSYSWFYFDVEPRNASPLEITIASDSLQDAQFLGITVNPKSKNLPTSKPRASALAIKADCPPRVLPTNSPHLTFQKSARMILTTAFAPKLEAGRWFFGFSLQNFTAEKEFNITVAFGPGVSTYFEKMLVPPFVGVALIVICLIIGLFITRTLSRKIGAADLVRRRFTWDFSKLALATGILFLVPGFQYISTQVSLMWSTGNRDICSYNELCMRPSPPSLGIPAWNNVFSNIGYIISGIGFIIYIYTFRWFSKRDHITAGIPLNASIPYAMGAAIALEGIASGMYHMCPSRLIFQFDTANMFLIMVLGLAEMWRRMFNRPDGATVFTLVAIMLLMNFIGIHADQVGGDAPIIAAYVSFALLTLVFFFFLFPFMMKGPKQRYFEFLSVKGLKSWKENIPVGRTSLLVILYAVNSATLLLINLSDSVDFDYALSLLAMGTISLSIATIAYEVSNLRYIRYAPKSFLAMKAAYFLTFVGLWGAALYFYVLDSYNVRLSAAASRNLNTPCYLADFYDTHDVWHFISALALFVMCLVIFHLDLNATYQKKRIGEWHWAKEQKEKSEETNLLASEADMDQIAVNVN